MSLNGLTVNHLDPMSKYDRIVQIWFSDQVPQRLKHLCCDNCEWVALIPSGLALDDLEMVILHSITDRRLITRQLLDDGSIVFIGSTERSK